MMNFHLKMVNSVYINDEFSTKNDEINANVQADMRNFLRSGFGSAWNPSQNLVPSGTIH